MKLTLLDIEKETNSTIDEKLSSPFWRNFILGWITWNWKVWYVTFFVSESRVGNKVEYIKTLYEYLNYDWFHYMIGIFISWVIIPSVISFLIVFFITPYVSLYFLKKHNENKVEENNSNILRNKSESEKIKSEIDILEAEIIKQRENSKKEQINFEEKLQRVLKEKLEEQRQRLESEYNDKLNNPDIKKEYFNFIKKNNSKSALKSLENVVYNHKGRYSFGGEKRINSEELRVIDVNGLAIINTNGYLEITKKGKEFIRIYSDV